MEQSCLSFTILLAFLFILLRFNFNRHMSAIPHRHYPILFAVPIVSRMFQYMPCILPNKNSLSSYRNEFSHITGLVIIIVVAVYKSTKGSHIKNLFCFLSDGILNIIPVGKGAVNGFVGLNPDLAVCTAIVAACATLSNVQCTLKQESTKNRQVWITSVRF